MNTATTLPMYALDDLDDLDTKQPLLGCFSPCANRPPQSEAQHGPRAWLGLFAQCLALLGLCVGLFGALSARAQDLPQLNLPRVSITAGFYQIDAQVAQTPEQREVGLMFRQTMPQHEGMIFVFDEPAMQCFWMKNTHLPLSAAFIADNGEIVNIEDMKPYSTNSHCSARAVRFVLEMQQGWFAKKNLKSGFKLSAPIFQK